ncbi:hypothetical protein OJ997_01630 [Solirubrobacter phytolaccae]|uniref:Uncharacterized protein n=1 Tax=Solirubrobacter phytolaccae TaxID=1404360 RepID=A0A9X3N3D7_9ACTN|nr:hypothetical protein [Solirubrobacter phytolaccae]MDA0178978.1 hypothetical protein [Solirubrobacter phytolaccae]
MRTGLWLLIVAALLVAPASAYAPPSPWQLGDPIVLPFKSPDDAPVRSASSGPAHGTALIVGERVHYADAAGRWHAFGIPDARDVGLARLENGGGLVTWGDGRTQFVRTWTHDGVLAPAQAVMPTSDSFTVTLTYDEAGTVVIVAVHPRVVVAVRDPGGAFGAAQDLGPISDEGLFTFFADIKDGAPDLSWEGHRLVRPGPGAAFIRAPLEAPDDTVIAADDSRRVPIGPAVRKACKEGCVYVRLFTWPDGTARLLYRTGREDHDDWRVALPGADGVFDGDRVATRLAATEPVWTARPGVVAFARQAHPGVALVPYGEAPRSKPRVRVLRSHVEGSRLLVYVLCTATCRLSVDGARIYEDGGFSASTAPLRRALEPFEVVRVSLPRPRGGSARLPYTLRDVQGTAKRGALRVRLKR